MTGRISECDRGGLELCLGYEKCVVSGKGYRGTGGVMCRQDCMEVHQGYLAWNEKAVSNKISAVIKGEEGNICKSLKKKERR